MGGVILLVATPAALLFWIDKIRADNGLDNKKIDYHSLFFSNYDDSKAGEPSRSDLEVSTNLLAPGSSFSRAHTHEYVAATPASKELPSALDFILLLCIAGLLLSILMLGVYVWFFWRRERIPQRIPNELHSPFEVGSPPPMTPRNQPSVVVHPRGSLQLAYLVQSLSTSGRSVYNSITRSLTSLRGTGEGSSVQEASGMYDRLEDERSSVLEDLLKDEEDGVGSQSFPLPTGSNPVPTGSIPGVRVEGLSKSTPAIQFPHGDDNSVATFSCPLPGGSVSVSSSVWRGVDERSSVPEETVAVNDQMRTEGDGVLSHTFPLPTSYSDAVRFEGVSHSNPLMRLPESASF